jgi:hypothetical protein
VDTSRSRIPARIAQMSGGDSMEYPWRGGDAKATCAFTTKMEVVQVL